MIKNRLKQIRLNMAAEQGRDISQTEFAAMLGIARRTLCKWEANHDQPNAESIWRLLKILKLQFTDMFYEEETLE